MIIEEKRRERTISQIEEIRERIMGGTVFLCIYSNDTLTCQGDCSMFNNCWKYDYRGLEKSLP